MGEVFAGRYELLSRLAPPRRDEERPGSQTGWLIRDVESAELMAGRLLGQSQAYSLLRIVRRAGQFANPHIVLPQGSETERGIVLFPMQLVRGGALSGLIRRSGALPAPFVAEVLRNLSDALTTVHEAGFVHRDVRPANVLLGATGTARPVAFLSDFGAAHQIDGPRITRTGHTLADPRYMAPELQSGGDPAPASDMWALGAVAEAMLTGASPSGRPVPHLPAHTPLPLLELVVRLLSPSPRQRPDAAAARQLLADADLAWDDAHAASVEVTDLYLRTAPSSIARPMSPSAPIVPALPARPAPNLIVPERDAAETVARQAEPLIPLLEPAPPSPDTTAAGAEPVTTSAPDLAETVPAAGQGDKRGRKVAGWFGAAAAVLVGVTMIGSVLHFRPDAAGSSGGSPLASAPAATAPTGSAPTASGTTASGATASGTGGPGSTETPPPAGPTGSAPSGTDRTTSPGSPTVSPGRFQVGTVVLKVGQPCLDVGGVTTTVDGTPVVCSDQSGRLIWIAD